MLTSYKHVPVMLLVLAVVPTLVSIGHATDSMRTAIAVNGNSVDSLTIANHYADLRLIPDISIVVLDSVPTESVIRVSQFRDQVLRPLMNELDQRGLAIQADTVAYSAGFPTAIHLNEDLAKVPDLHKVFTPVGSPNGLTALYQFVLSANPEYVAPLSNYYARRDSSQLLENPFLGSERAIFDEALQDAKGKNFRSAIEKLKPLAEKHPLQWPLQFHLAGWLNQMGQRDQAIEMIKRLIDSGNGYRKMFDQESGFDALRTDQEYQRLVAKASATMPNRYPAVPFSARQVYGVNGLPLADPTQGMRYLLSAVLAVTDGRGSSLMEAIESLKRSVAADATGKPAEFYFSNSSDVRAQTRMPLVPVAAVLLKEMGHEVIIETDRLPTKRKRLMGAMLGAANYDWPPTMNDVLPGAILENLTSTSGVMYKDTGQTSMIELIRAGAAGTSGTVTEPYALQFKFPTPMIYPYYAAGCTLAEAFYLSVESPYQLLIIGDPLCRPYGDQHNEAFSLKVQEGADAYQLSVQFWRGANAVANIGALEIYLNGKLASVIPPTGQLNIKKESIPVGFQELTIGAISRHPLRMRGFQTVRLSGASATTPKLTAAVEGAGDNVIIKANVESADGKRVAVRHLGRRIAEVDGAKGVVEIPVSKTGYGPVRMIPEVLVDQKWVRGEPVILDIEIPQT